MRRDRWAGQPPRRYQPILTIEALSTADLYYTDVSGVLMRVPGHGLAHLYVEQVWFEERGEGRRMHAPVKARGYLVRRPESSALRIVWGYSGCRGFS